MPPNSSSIGRALCFLLGRRIQSRHWIYLLAAALPLSKCIWFAFSPYRFSIEYCWPYILVSGICLVQWLRPTVAGWATVLVLYGLALMGVLLSVFQEEFGEYASEHGGFTPREMGWLAGIAIAIVFILVFVARRFPKARSHTA